MSLSPAIIVLWIYVVLLVVGGLMGFLKARSTISLISSIVFAIPLAVCAATGKGGVTAPILIGILLVIFGIRFAGKKKFMPSGLMFIVSAIALVALLVLR
jgi:uncharacterized membrane protein (UPF0136 family)